MFSKSACLSKLSFPLNVAVRSKNILSLHAWQCAQGFSSIGTGVACLAVMLAYISICIIFVLVESTLPIFQDDEFIPTFHQDAVQLEGWTWPQLGAAVQFAWGLTLRMCSQYASDLVAEVELLNEDDTTVTMAILNDAFDFLRKTVVGSRNFYEEVCFF